MIESEFEELEELRGNLNGLKIGLDNAITESKNLSEERMSKLAPVELKINGRIQELLNDKEARKEAGCTNPDCWRVKIEGMDEIIGLRNNLSKLDDELSEKVLACKAKIEELKRSISDTRWELRIKLAYYSEKGV